MRQPGKVEVTSGLNPGDLVVTAGQQRIQKDGMAVRVMDLPRASTGEPQAAADAGGRGTATAGVLVPADAGNPCGTVASNSSRSTPAARPRSPEAPPRAPMPALPLRPEAKRSSLAG
jgi:membrane fusion protein (multidrug efflux system)